MNDVIKLPIVNIYRIKTDKGEVLFPRNEFAYLRNGEQYNHQEVHDLNRFRCDENTSHYNILMTPVYVYDREADEIIEDADVFQYVGHVTVEEWNQIAAANVPSNSEPSTKIMDKVLDLIKAKTGIDRRKQFKDQDYGPDYWDDVKPEGDL